MKDRQLRLLLIVIVILIFTPLILISRGNKEESEKVVKIYIEDTEAMLPPGHEDGTWVKPSDEQLRENLSAMQYEVTQEEGTEPAFQNEFWDSKEKGISYLESLYSVPLINSNQEQDGQVLQNRYPQEISMKL
ncbi:MAG: peptide-methionine (R)-S-oxide reductase [Sphaerochaetaceae bacterium]|nr:peptide-methionine (R)-S-oxide reductase [Sphaerochaetaceae bacterium]